MAGHAAVGVDDDLAAGEAGVAHRAADLEAAGRVDQRPVVGHVEVGAGVTQLGEDRLEDVRGDVGREHAVERHVGGVLGRQDDRVELDGAVAVVGDRHLGLAVGAQVGEVAVLADLGEPLGEPVREVDRQRHQLGGVVARVAEHQALVASALLVEGVDAAVPVLVGGVDALRDVGALGSDGDRDAAGAPVEALLGAVVADLEDRLADERGDLDVADRRHLTGDVDEPRRHEGLDGDPRVRVLGEQGVEDRVADLVADLVRVSLGDGLGREQTCGHLRSWTGRKDGTETGVRRGGESVAVSAAAAPRRPRRPRPRRPWTPAPR